jgi:excisionase family DNA binding protein
MDRMETVKTRVLTVQEVSKYLRVHPSTIYRMLKRNQLPAFRVGSDWRFTVEAIDKWRAEAELEALGRPLEAEEIGGAGRMMHLEQEGAAK